GALHVYLSLGLARRLELDRHRPRFRSLLAGRGRGFRARRPRAVRARAMSAALEMVAVAGLATVQDAGRPGRMHEGIPAGGALVPELLARANRAVGNAPGAAALEIFGRARARAVSAEVTFAL